MKVSEVHKHIVTLYEAGCRHTVLLLGPPGIGKSEAVKNAAEILTESFNKKKKEGEEKEVVRFEQWQATIEDPLELPGLPAVIDGKAVRVPFENKIPSVGRGLLAIDEINSASSLTQCSLYSLIWDKKLGGSVLGKDWMIIATGNRDGDKGVTQRMPTPLVSRMEHINVEADHDSWIIKMAVDDADETTRAFIKMRPELFVKFDPNVPGPFPCPRTWTMVGKVMKAYGKNEVPLESIAGWVGEGPAVEFLTYKRMASALVDPEVIIKDPMGAPVPKNNPGGIYALTTALAGRARYENITNILIYLKRLPVEFAVYCITLAREVERGRVARMSDSEKSGLKKIRENKTFVDWAIAHHNIIAD